MYLNLSLLNGKTSSTEKDYYHDTKEHTILPCKISQQCLLTRVPLLIIVYS